MIGLLNTNCPLIINIVLRAGNIIWQADINHPPGGDAPGERREDMSEKDKNMLAGLLIQYSQEELRPQEIIATNDRDFEKLGKIYKISGAIDTILKSFK